ncbi:MAG: hypothetical protein ACYTF1_22855 [Planctomycetota bacterium]|jgi:hypothetical protein
MLIEINKLEACPILEKLNKLAEPIITAEFAQNPLRCFRVTYNLRSLGHCTLIDEARDQLYKFYRQYLKVHDNSMGIQLEGLYSVSIGKTSGWFYVLVEHATEFIPRVFLHLTDHRNYELSPEPWIDHHGDLKILYPQLAENPLDQIPGRNNREQKERPHHA